MSHIHINTEFSDLTLRIEKIIYLAASNIDHDLSGDLKELAEDESVEELIALFELPGNCFGDDPTSEDVAQALLDFKKFGFLIQAATPLRKHYSEYSWAGGWGRYYTKWLYAETLDEALGLAKTWAESKHAQDLAKFKDVGGAA